MRTHFTKCQKSARKNVDKAFGVLQAQWEIVMNLVRHLDLKTISKNQSANLIPFAVCLAKNQTIDSSFCHIAIIYSSYAQ